MRFFCLAMLLVCLLLPNASSGKDAQIVPAPQCQVSAPTVKIDTFVPVSASTSAEILTQEVVAGSVEDLRSSVFDGEVTPEIFYLGALKVFHAQAARNVVWGFLVDRAKKTPEARLPSREGVDIQNTFLLNKQSLPAFHRAWRDAVRTYLRVPSRLEAVMALFQPVLMEEIGEGVSSDDLRAAEEKLDWILQRFEAPVPKKLREALAVEAQIYERYASYTWQDACQTQIRIRELLPAQDQVVKLARGTPFEASRFTDAPLEVLRFRLRREAEGGEDLVAALAQGVRGILEALRILPHQ